MRNKVIIAILALISISCSVQTNTNVKPTPSSTPKPIESIISIPIPSPSPSFFFYTGNNPDEENCTESLEDGLKRKIDAKYPADLVVSKDGKYIYFSKMGCPSSVGHDPQFILDYKDCGYKSFGDAYRNLKRNFIYKLNIETKKIEILKINGKPPKSCGIGGSIEKDIDGDLYFDGTNKVIKISEKNNSITELGKFNEYSKQEFSLNPPNNRRPKLEGIYWLYVEGKSIYFIIASPDSNGEVILRKVEQDNSFVNMYESVRNMGIDPFGIYKGKVYPASSGIFDNYIENNKVKNLSSFTTMRVNSKGEIFLNSNDFHYILKLLPSQNKAEIFAGSGKSGYKDGKGDEAEFNFPNSFDIDANDNLYVADTKNHAIRKITPDGVVSTIYKEPS